MATGRPVETEYANYQANGGSYIWPSPYGAHNWQPMSYSPKTGLMYIPVQNIPHYFSAQETVKYKLNRWNTGVDLNESRDPLSWVAGQASMDALISGELLAWDPVNQKPAWKVPHQGPANGGVLSTSGDLVFQGMGTGTFAAYDADNGDPLWQYQSDSAVLAGPMTYELDGEQYIAVAQGSGGTVMLTIGDNLKRNKVNQNKLLVFKLGDFGLTKTLPDESLATILPLSEEVNASPEVIKKGEQLYGHNCGSCHGISAKSNYVVPDLRYMSDQTHRDFIGIVLGGSRAHKGMVGFYETNTAEDVQAIHSYLKNQQQRLPEMVEMSFLQKIEYWFTYGAAKLGEKYPWMLNATRDMMY
jgi:mono/diheme cytochrome c family protein